MKQFKIAIGADHRGFLAKSALIQYLQENQYNVIDLGTDSTDSCDHPAIAIAVGQAVTNGKADRGILICGSGHGMNIAVNKVKGVRAVHPINAESAKLSRMHNDANVIIFGSDFMGVDTIIPILHEWLITDFVGEHYQRRIDQISQFEKDQ